MGALMLIIGMFTYFRMPITESYIIQNTFEKNRSMILGIYFFSAMEGSGVLTPLVGYAIDHIGFSSTYTIAAVSIFLVTLCCWLILRSNPDRPGKGQPVPMSCP
jgi:sugar phosphate permease